MKNLIFILCLYLSVQAIAQEKEKSYSSYSSEMIFSFATIDNQGNSDGNIMRWAPVFNPQWMLNHDFNNSVGLFTGMAVRNVGFIYEVPNDSNDSKFKYRTYNFAVPVGFKVGQMDKFILFGGYEIEFPLVYKEKLFLNDSKEDKDVVWFSDRVEQIQHSVMFGIQLPKGAAIKFKYYLTNFHNRDYNVKVNGVETKPYDFKSNVFYFSFSYNLFTKSKGMAPLNSKKELKS